MNKHVYLVAVNASNNNYKYYEMMVSGSQIQCKYGRMNKTCQQVSYPYTESKWNSLYNSKIKKGYEDMSSVYLTEDIGNTSKKTSKIPEGVNKEQVELYNFLVKFTNEVLSKTFTNINNINQSMVDASEFHLSNLQDIYNKYAHHNIYTGQPNVCVKMFNDELLDLMKVNPRTISTGSKGVKSWLAKDPSDFFSVIERESELIEAMKSKVAYSSPTDIEETDVRYIHDRVFTAYENQVEEVKRHLPYNLRDKVKKVYRVVPKQKSKDFKNWCNKRNIQKKKLLWHGSRNENWLSIIQNSLQLNPNAVITGKMFGQGIYFAPDANKSWGYTSSGKWTGGRSLTNIMGLYEVAYGNPQDCYSWNSTMYNMNQKKLDKDHTDCLHAHAGNDLRADEIVFYSEDAMCLKYIVVFE